jgi:nucleoside-diphosphate kinase
MANLNERTYIMVKPDGVQRGLVGEIIRRFEQRGYQLTALKMISVSESKFENSLVLRMKILIFYFN